MQERLSKQILSLCNDKGELVTTLSALNDQLKDQSLGVFIILLSFPSALPVPAAGYSTPFGILLLWIGWLFLRGGQQIQLPNKWLNKPFKINAKIVRGGIKLITFLEKFIHPNRAPKLYRLINRRLVGINLMLLALIMALPIPLTNTAPAAIILLFGLGLLENDGWVLAIAQILAFFLIMLYGIATFVICTFGVATLNNILQWVHISIPFKS